MSSSAAPQAPSGAVSAITQTLAAKARIIRDELLYGPLIVLLAAALTVRLATMVLYQPAIMTLADSPRFARIDPSGLFDDFYMPALYPMLLEVLRAISDQLWFTIAIQHLGGLVVGVIVYLAMRRLGLRRALACIPSAYVLLVGDLLYLEHVLMADWLLFALATTGLAAGVRGLVPRIDRGWLAAAGVLLMAAGLARSVGLVLPLVLIVVVVWLGAAPLRARLGGAGVAAAGAAVVLAGYLGAFALAGGRYTGLTDFAGWNLYSRVAPFADCSRFDPPDGTEVLCETTPPEQRPGPFGYVWSADSVSRRNFDPLGPETGGPLGEFAREAITHQPLEYLGAVGEDFARYFDPGINRSQPLSGQSPELISFGFHDPTTEANVVAALDQRYDGVALEASGDGVLSTYQEIVRVDTLPLVASLVVTLLAIVLARGALRLGAALFGLAALALYLGPVLTNSYDFRYGIPPGVLLVIAASAGACGLAVRYLDRASVSVLEHQT